MPLVATRPSRRAGKFNRRIDIQQATALTDADTADTDLSTDLTDADAGVTWTTVMSAWASVQPNATSGGIEGREAEQGELQWLVQMPYQEGILNGMRVYEAAKNLYLDILAALDVYEQQVITELHCVSRRYPPV
jgi:head-tail adaptor